MARSRKKPSARTTSKAGATFDSPTTDDLDELTSDETGTSTDTVEDDATSSTSTAAATGKDPVKSSRTAGKDPVTSKKSAGKGGKKTEKTPGSEVTEKAKDATRTPSAKKAAAAESARTGRRRVASVAPNPVWLAPTAVVLLILGLLYLVTYYLSSGQLPLPIDDWNLAVGFGLMLIGGGMLMFWK